VVQERVVTAQSETAGCICHVVGDVLSQEALLGHPYSGLETVCSRAVKPALPGRIVKLVVLFVGLAMPAQGIQHHTYLVTMIEIIESATSMVARLRRLIPPQFP